MSAPNFPLAFPTHEIPDTKRDLVKVALCAVEAAHKLTLLALESHWKTKIEELDRGANLVCFFPLTEFVISNCFYLLQQLLSFEI